MSRWRARVDELVSWAVEAEGSTRSCGLIRIGLALLIWARWAQELIPPNDPTSPKFVALSLCFFAATTLMLFGLYARLATLATAAIVLFMVYYVGEVLGRPGWGHHHTHLLATATALCALSPCGASYSLDRWRAVRRAERAGAPAPPERGRLWALRLIALQVSLVYLWSALDKSSAEFLGGDRIEAIYVRYYTASDYPAWVGFHACAVALSWATVALEYALGLGLLWGPTRRWLVVPGLLFHGILYLTLPVLTFSLTVWLLYLAYFDPDAVERAIDRVQGYAGRIPARA